MVIGFSVKVLIENNMKRALIISGFDWEKAFVHPLTMTIFVIIVLLLIWPYVSSFKKIRKNRGEKK